MAYLIKRKQAPNIKLKYKIFKLPEIKTGEEIFFTKNATKNKFNIEVNSKNKKPLLSNNFLIPKFLIKAFAGMNAK